jgi:hypothetical protein
MAVRDVDIMGLHVTDSCWRQEGDPVWITVRPNLRRVHVLAGDILSALGKTRDVSGKGRNESEDVLLAAAWLAGHRTKDLVLVGVELLHPRILHSATTLAATAGVNLWLLHRPPMSDIVHHAIRRRSTSVTAFEEVPQPSQPELATASILGLPAVPNHDFHLFAAAVVAELGPTEADAVLCALHDGIANALDNIVLAGDPRTGVITSLTTLVRAAPARAELVTGIRAIQVAAWNHDLHVSVDLTQLLNSEERPRVSPENAAQALLSYRQPYRALAWTLAHHQVGVEEAVGLLINATDPTGTTIATTNGTLTVPEPLAGAVRAQRSLRHHAGAAQEEPLILCTAKTLGYALTDAANDLGLPAHGRLAERRSLAPQAWLKKLGITIRSLP